MPTRFFAEVRSIIGMAMLVMLQIAGGAGLAQAEDSGTVEFRNRTEATIRIDPLAEPQEPNIAPVTVMPNDSLTIAVPAGERRFDFIAFRTNPQHIHHTVVTVLPGEVSVFSIIPHIMGRYILEDADSLASFAAIPSGPKPEILPHEHGGRIAERCEASLDGASRGAVIWNEGELSSARYYKRAADYLCAVDGSDAFFVGPIYNHFVCRVSWQDCSRHVDGDAIPLPLIRTSSFFADDALAVARLHDPNAWIIETQTLDWLRGNQTASRLTTYYIE